MFTLLSPERSFTASIFLMVFYCCCDFAKSYFGVLFAVRWFGFSFAVTTSVQQLDSFVKPRCDGVWLESFMGGTPFFAMKRPLDVSACFFKVLQFPKPRAISTSAHVILAFFFLSILLLYWVSRFQMDPCPVLGALYHTQGCCLLLFSLKRICMHTNAARAKFWMHRLLMSYALFPPIPLRRDAGQRQGGVVRIDVDTGFGGTVVHEGTAAHSSHCL